MIFFFEIGRLLTVEAQLFKQQDYRQFKILLSWRIRILGWNLEFMTGFPDSLLREINAKREKPRCPTCDPRPTYVFGYQCIACNRKVLGE